MCTTCGCGEGETLIEGDAPGHPHLHRHADGTVHEYHPVQDGGHAHRNDAAAWGGRVHRHADGTVHSHGTEAAHEHIAEAEGHLHYGTGPAHAHAPGMTQSRMLSIEQDILAKNDAYAGENRQWLARRGIFAVNLVSSPGSGKTTLLCRTIEALRDGPEVVVIEGDQQTTFDADRIRATGARALQVNTGKGCHLDAHMVGHALARLAPPEDSVLMIENVGNLVCPAAFDLGEAHKVVVLSVTEGEDKPLKYPDMFHAADLMLLNKIDLLPYLQFDVERCVTNARRVNPGITVIALSATSGEGMDAWQQWIMTGADAARAQRAATIDTLERRIAELEAQVAHLRA